MSTPASIIRPTDRGYDEARAAFDLSDQRPAAISLAGSVAEVQDAIRYARATGLKVANQATGHVAVALPALEETLLLKPRIDPDPWSTPRTVSPGSGPARRGDRSSRPSPRTA
jgi:hypothetical protein